MRLTIISHTEHYLTEKGGIVGLGSTVTEINHLLDVFDHITHVAMLHASSAPANALPYESEKISFVAIPAVGGTTLLDKLKIIKTIPEIIRVINRVLKTSDYFQFRAPTGIGVFVIPYLIFYTKISGWFKYAGNWKQPNAPIAYRFQKWLLELQSRPVTINGSWKDQSKHCLSFENPCLTQDEVHLGQRVRGKRIFEYPLDFCFVGRLEAAKGIDMIMEAFIKINVTSKAKVGTIHIVGDGERIGYYKEWADKIGVTFLFHGLLSRKQVQEVYKQSHVLLLPSVSEGFPKVIAEAMNYGCIPIVSNVSSIEQYIKNKVNGYVMNQLVVNDLHTCIQIVLDLNQQDYRQLIANNEVFSELFTFSYYNKRIINELL